MYPVIVQLGTFELRSYGIVVALSFLLGLWLSAREAKRNGLDPALVQHFALYALLGGIIGARLYFVVFSNPAYFLQKPWEIVAVWHGGISIVGALLGGFLAALWYCRKKQLPFWRFADTLAPGVALGQAAGVIACLLNGDSYGKRADVAWAITYTDPRSMGPLHVPLCILDLPGGLWSGPFRGRIFPRQSGDLCLGHSGSAGIRRGAGSGRDRGLLPAWGRKRTGEMI